MRTVKFKSSEVGPIPEEWEVKSLGELFSFKNGYNTDAKNYGRGVSVASVLEALADRPLKAPKIRGKVIAPQKDQDSFSLKRGDLIFTRSSETLEDVGRSNVYDDDAPAMFGGFVIRGRPKTENNSTCINLILKTHEHRDRVMSQGAGAQHYNIGQSGLERVLVTLPPRPEQERIAEALSDVDALLAAMTTLIEKKRAIKQGAMQQLLTGKKRLAGFIGPWVEKRLGDVGEFVGGGTPSTAISSYWGGDIDWYTPAEIGYAKYVNSSNRRITNEGLRNSAARVLPAGAILLTTRASIGLRAILKHEAATNQGFQSLIVNEESDSEFMYYFLSTVVEEMESRASGSTFLEISSSKLKEIPIVVPQTVAEQKGIASVLSDMDAEIVALEAKHAKYESIKQGMMQELLTGKTRLVETGFTG